MNALANVKRVNGSVLPPDLANSLVQLLDCAHRNLDADREIAKDSLARASSLLQIELERSTSQTKSYSSGGLAGWQRRRVLAFIEAQLDDPVHLHELAAIAGLSKAYFSKAFKRTFEMTPHAYIMRRRLEKAETLMLTSDLALVEIALCCGFSDQAHLSRLFDRQYGQSPAAWRRERTELSGQRVKAYRKVGRNGADSARRMKFNAPG